MGKIMKNKAIMITGANGNIGSFLTKKYLRKGEKLILCIHEKNDRITDVLSNENVRVIKTNLVDLSSFQTRLNEILIDHQFNWGRVFCPKLPPPGVV